MIDYENKLRPIHSWVLAKTIKIEKVTAGGIYIPTGEGVEERPNTARVIAKGLGKRNDKGHHESIDINIGDQIYYGIYAGIDIEDGLILIKYEEIMGVIEP